MLTCSQCGTPTQPQDKYCSLCGEILTLAQAPSLYQTPPSPTHHPSFTINGTTTHTHAEEGERRTVTVLLADLSEFTKLSEKSDPEEVRSLLNDCFECMSGVIAKYDGSIDKFIGDAMLARFGIPVGHEDDPRRACLAALEIKEKVQEFSKTRKTAVPFGLKIGINTGLVVVGSIGSSEKKEHTIIGDAVNLASRLEDLCGTWQILVGESTHRKVEKQFSFRDAGKHAIRGKEEPVEVFELLRAEEPVEKGAEARDRWPLVGRGVELSLMATYVSQVKSGRGQMVAIVGEAGIGKSRLMREAAFTFLKKEGFRVIKARALSYSAQNAFHLVTDLLGSWLEIHPFESLPEICDRMKNLLQSLELPHEDILPLLSPLLGASAEETSTMDPEVRKRRIFEALKATLKAQAFRAGPLALLLEDVHWADSASIEFIGNLLDEMDQLPVLVLATLRPGMEHHWVRSARYTQIVLKELAQNESLELAAIRLGGGKFSERLEALLLERCEGNPLYLEELVSILRERQELTRRGEGWDLVSQASQLDMPESVEAIVLSRVDRLPEPCRHIIRAASVIGRIFNRDLLSRICSQNPVGAHLEVIGQAGMIFPRPGDPENPQFIFKHVLTQEAVYKSILLSERRRLHAEVAKILEETPGGVREEHLTLLAHHWSKSGNIPKSIFYLIASADRAQRLFANDTAMAQYQEAIALAEKSGDFSSQAECAFRTGQIHTHLGKLSDARRALEKALHLTRSYGMKKSLLEAETLFEMGRIHRREGDYAKAMENLEEALSMAEALGQETLLAKVLHRMGNIHRYQGNPQKALACFEKSASLAARLQDRALESFIQNAYAEFYVDGGEYGKALRHLERSMEYARQSQNKEQMAHTEISLGNLYFRTGEFAKAAAILERALSVMTEIGNRAAENWASSLLGEVYLRMGELPKALAYETNALKMAEMAGYKVAGALCLRMMGTIHRRLGNLKEGFEAKLKAYEIIKEMGIHRYLAQTLQEVASAGLSLGQVEEASARFSEALRLTREAKDPVGEARTLFNLGILAHFLGQYVKALECLETSLSIRQQIGETVGEGYCLNGLVYLWADLGEAEKTQACAAKAIEICQATGYKDILPWAFGSAARSSAIRGDFAGSRENARRALDLSRQMGYQRYESVALFDLGFAAYSLGQIEESITYFRQSAEVLEKMGDRMEIPRPYIGLGLAHFSRGDMEQAASAFENARRIAQPHGKRYLWWAHFYLGQIDERRKHDASAEENYTQALRIQEEIVRPMSSNLARVYLRSGDRSGVAGALVTLLERQGKSVDSSLREYQKKVEAFMAEKS